MPLNIYNIHEKFTMNIMLYLKAPLYFQAIFYCPM
jgi:hypothetical protein